MTSHNASEKPKLVPAEQVERMANEGIAFEIMSKDEAARFLSSQGNYFKMASYRKLYQKGRDGKGVERYSNLDFGHLVDLFEIDRQLQRTLLLMALDVESAAKVKLLSSVDAREGEDGYTIVRDHFESLPERIRRGVEADIARKASDAYCGEMVEKYSDCMPAWVFLELVTFGEFNSFYLFCSKRWGDRRMEREHYYLKRSKSVRNAAAHGLCIVNGFTSGKGATPRTPPEVAAALAEYGVRDRMRRRGLSVERLQQIAVLCYAFQTMTDEGVRYPGTVKALNALRVRMRLNNSYYAKNTAILSSFEFLDRILTFATKRP